MDLWRPHSVPLTSALCAEISCTIKIVFLQLDFYVLEVKATGRQFWRAGLVVSDNCVVHNVTFREWSTQEVILKVMKLKAPFSSSLVHYGLLQRVAPHIGNGRFLYQMPFLSQTQRFFCLLPKLNWGFCFSFFRWMCKPLLYGESKLLNLNLKVFDWFPEFVDQTLYVHEIVWLF